MAVDLLNPTTLASAAAFDDAHALLVRLLATTDGDELADLLEHAVDKADRAHGLLFLMLCRLRGWDETRTGVEFVAAAPTPGMLIVVAR